MVASTATSEDFLIYRPKLFKAEYKLASLLAEAAKASCQKVEPVLEGLKSKQPEAVINACKSSVSIITGQPGTGKTTTLKQVIASFNHAGMKGIVLGPTGKAAKRAKEAIQDRNVACSTVHVGLEYNVFQRRFLRNRNNKLECDYVVLDEFPMVSCEMACCLLEAIDFKKTRLIFSGDPYQLPSIDPGNIGRDIINSGVFPTVQLNEILRQGPNSGIVHAANRILSGDFPIKNDPVTGELFTDFYFVSSNDPQQTAKHILQYITKSLPKKRGYDPLRDIQCLSPGKKSVVGTEHLNNELRKVLNPNGKSFGKFRLGDKVMNRRNTRSLGIVNGDAGIILDGTKSGLLVDYGEGAGADETGKVVMSRLDQENLELSYANTIHTSQGSEYPVVIMPLHRCHYQMLFRSLVYTGITRGKQLTCMIGEKDALATAITNNSAGRRISRLDKLLVSMVA